MNISVLVSALINGCAKISKTHKFSGKYIDPVLRHIKNWTKIGFSMAHAEFQELIVHLYMVQIHWQSFAQST